MCEESSHVCVNPTLSNENAFTDTGTHVRGDGLIMNLCQHSCRMLHQCVYIVVLFHLLFLLPLLLRKSFHRFIRGHKPMFCV